MQIIPVYVRRTISTSTYISVKSLGGFMQVRGLHSMSIKVLNNILYYKLVIGRTSPYITTLDEFILDDEGAHHYEYEFSDDSPTIVDVLVRGNCSFEILGEGTV